MPFVKGDRVEVEKRHVRSYRSATVLGKIDYASQSCYLVQYANSTTDVVKSEDIRRSPPWIPATRFAVNDHVDAFDGCFWWSGTIARKKGPSDYYVHFEVPGVEVSYNLCHLRAHLDRLENGYWVSKKIRF